MDISIGELRPLDDDEVDALNRGYAGAGTVIRQAILSGDSSHLRSFLLCMYGDRAPQIWDRIRVGLLSRNGLVASA